MHDNVRDLLACLILAATAFSASAQDKGTLEPHTLPPLAHPDDPKTPAKQLFGRKSAPTQGESRVVGFYASGCLAGGTALPINGPAWQVMRLSRNRNWGHPALVRFLEDLGTKVHQAGTWNGLLVGDMSQPRGGPMITGHASHQVGLDADIWLTPMPNRELNRVEREEMSAVNMVAADRRDVDPSVWTPGQLAVIKTAALDPRVERIFVNAAIKKALCRDSSPDRAWMSKVRPYWGHDYHFHVRLYCPPRQRVLQAASAAAARRRLRQGAELVVHRCGAPPEALASAREAGETEAGNHHGCPTTRLPRGVGGAVIAPPVGVKRPHLPATRPKPSGQRPYTAKARQPCGTARQPGIFVSSRGAWRPRADPFRIAAKIR